jgi:hypothetical protein
MTTAGADWSTTFRRSTVHPAVFAVRDPGAAKELLAWAAEGRLPHRHKAYAFSAELDGWALLDGGLSDLHSRARGRLRSGMRVVGWSALRLVSAELGLTPPRRLLMGEPGRRSDADLRRLAEVGWVVVGPPVRQAGLLVSYVDARGLFDVACALVGHAPQGRRPALVPSVV